MTTLMAPKFKEKSNTRIIVSKGNFDSSHLIGVKPKFLFLDANTQGSYASELSSFVQSSGGVVYKLQGGEELKSLDNFFRHIEALKNYTDMDVVICGSGALINMALYAVGELDGDNTEITIIPSNTMAIADVALGSLGMMNTRTAKNSVRHVVDPSQIVVSQKLFEEAPTNAQTDGMIELIKHSVVQDAEIFTPSVKAFLGTTYETKDLFELAVRALELKLDVQCAELSNGRSDVRAILNYGHSHAHVLETIYDFQIPHSIAVYAGLILDLRLAGPKDAADSLRNFARSTGYCLKLSKVFNDIDLATFPEAYRCYLDHRKEKEIATIKLGAIGAHADLSAPIIQKSLSVDTVMGAIYTLAEDLRSDCASLNP